MATADLRREVALVGRGEPRPAAELRRLISAAFIEAAAARDTDEERGEGVSRRLRSIAGAAEYAERACKGEEESEREGGSELRSGAISELY